MALGSDPISFFNFKYTGTYVEKKPTVKISKSKRNQIKSNWTKQQTAKSYYWLGLFNGDGSLMSYVTLYNIGQFTHFVISSHETKTIHNFIRCCLVKCSEIKIKPLIIMCFYHFCNGIKSRFRWEDGSHSLSRMDKNNREKSH